MSIQMGALPGTIRSATIQFNIVALPARARGLATVSLLDDVDFNEVEAPARFSLLGLHVARMENLRVELCAASDSVEAWPRWTAKREFTVEVENLTDATIESKQVELLLWGYPPAPTPKVSEFTRTPALALTPSSDVVSAESKIGMPLQTQWRTVGVPVDTDSQIDWARLINVPDATTTTKGVTWFAADGNETAGRAVQATDSRLSDAREPLVVPEIAITTTATLTLSRSHVCSGTTADYTVTLPTATGNADKLLSVRMTSGLTKLVTVQGASGQLIDGQNSRLMWAQESAILLCDGTGWAKISGKTIPFGAKIRRDAANPAIASIALTKITCDTMVYASSPDMVSGGAITILRAGLYDTKVQLQWNQVSESASYIARVHRNSVSASNTIAQSGAYSVINSFPATGAPASEPMLAGESLLLVAQHSAGAAQTIYVTEPSNWISAVEVPVW